MISSTSASAPLFSFLSLLMRAPVRAFEWIRVKITAAPGSTFIDWMIALVEGAQRQKTPNELALSILLSGLTIIFLIVCVTLWPLAAYGDCLRSRRRRLYRAGHA